AGLEHAGGTQRHHGVAVHDRTRFVHDDQAVGVAVEGNADGGLTLAHLVLHVLWMHRAAVSVDVAAVGPHTEGDHLGAQLGKHRRGHLVGGAVGGVDHDTHAVQRQLTRERVLREHDIATGSVFDAHGAADPGARAALFDLRIGQQGFD